MTVTDRVTELAGRLVTGFVSCLLTTDTGAERAEQIRGLMIGTGEECHGEKEYDDVIHIALSLACSGLACALAGDPRSANRSNASLTPVVADLINKIIDAGTVER